MGQDGQPVILGKGQNGTMFLGILEGKCVAVKCEHNFDSGFHLGMFIPEPVFLSSINDSACSPRVIGLCRVAKDGPYDPIAIVMEYLGNSTGNASHSMYLLKCCQI